MQDVKQIRIQQALIVAGLAGVIALFLPFTYGVSPLDALLPLLSLELEGLLLGGPLFLAIPVTAASVRLLVTGSLSPKVKILAFLMSAGAVLIGIPIFAEVFAEHFPTYLPLIGREILFAIFTLTLIAGLLYFVVGLKKRSFGKYAPVAAMQVPYIVHSVALLYEFYWDGLQIGAYLIVLTAVSYLVQIFSYQLGRRSAQQ